MRLSFPISLLALAASALAMSACTSVPITSMPKLASLDAETMDLREVELAVRMQDDFDIIENSAVLSVSLKHKDTGDQIAEKFILTRNEAPLTPTLSGKLKEGYVIYRYEMNAETSELAMAHREKVIARRNADPGKHEGTFSARVAFCLTEDGNPFIDPRMTLFLRVDDDEDFFTMIKETKMPLPKGEDQQPKNCNKYKNKEDE